MSKQKVCQKELLLGNEAIARGALEAGVSVVAGYPGTPSSEVVEALLKNAENHEIYVEWSINEKVATECALAASYAGLRSMAVMKHLGINVAADSLMTLAYTGVKGGMVIISAGDAQCHTSQNEQDNRLFARLANIPILEPSDPQEAKDITLKAFDISEELELPVIINTTPRLSHTSSEVTLGELPEQKRKAHFERDPSRWVCIGPAALERHRWLITRIKEAQKLLQKWDLNQIILKGEELGIITSGVAYNYVREAVNRLGVRDDVSILKLSLTFPFPKAEVEEFLRKFSHILIVEELEPFLEESVLALAQKCSFDIEILGKEEGLIPLEGELNTELVTNAIGKVLGIRARPSAKAGSLTQISKTLPARPLMFCPGCPHRATFYALKQVVEEIDPRPIVTGDIGCYTMATSPPFEILDTCLCMGGGIGQAHGLAKAGVKEPIVAVIGDSTFFHAGMPALLNVSYNNSNVTVVVLDNGYTAMTGFQPNPSTGKTAIGKTAKKIKIEDIARALGIDFVKVVDSYRLKELGRAIKEAIEYKGPSVVISRRPCALQVAREARKEGVKLPLFRVDPDRCFGCKTCIVSFGCPALRWNEEKKVVYIDPAKCVGCGVCASVCPFDAIISDQEGEESERI